MYSRSFLFFFSTKRTGYPTSNLLRLIKPFFIILSMYLRSASNSFSKSL